MQINKGYYAHASFNGEDHSPVGEVTYADNYLNDDVAAAYAGQKDSANVDNVVDEGGVPDTQIAQDNQDEGTPYLSTALKPKSTAHKRDDLPWQMIGSRNRLSPTSLVNLETQDANNPKETNDTTEIPNVTNASADVTDSTAVETTETMDVIPATDATGTPTDYDYLVKYFPGGKHVYEFDEKNNIIGTSEVTLNNRKDIKRAVNSHWYFFNFGSIATEEKAKSLVEKLEKLIPNLSFTNHLKKKVF